MKLFKVGVVFFDNKAQAKAERDRLNLEHDATCMVARKPDDYRGLPFHVQKGPDHPDQVRVRNSVAKWFDKQVRT